MIKVINLKTFIFFLSFFPWVSFGLLKTDTQPYTLVLIILSILVNPKILVIPYRLKDETKFDFGSKDKEIFSKVSDNIYDFSNGRNLMLLKEVYYYLGKINQDKPKLYKYSFLEARQKMLQTGDFGPWDLITESGL